MRLASPREERADHPPRGDRRAAVDDRDLARGNTSRPSIIDASQADVETLPRAFSTNSTWFGRAACPTGTVSKTRS
jgi:hypothetical protein